MKVNTLFLTRTVGLLAGALLVLANVRAAEADAFPTFDNNYVKVSAGAPSLSGSKAAYQARTQKSSSGAAGIEELAYGYDLSKDVNLQLDGKAMPGAEDYLLSLKLTKNEVGSFEAGYKRFRTFYDGAGGFFPLNNAWLPIYRRALYVDRGQFFIGGTIALPKAPVVTIRYTNETRSGRKDSTIWGDSDLTGIPIYSLSSLNPISANRKILPAYIQLGERQEKLEASVKHTFGNTTAVVTMATGRIKNLDTRSVDRYAGELKPFPAIPSNPPVLVPNNFANNVNFGSDVQGFKEHNVSFGAKVETVITDKITFYTGMTYFHATEDISASRLINASIMTGAGVVTAIGPFTSGGRPPYSYTSSGSMKYDLINGNIGLQLKPVTDLYVDVALKGEQLKDSGSNNAAYVSNLLVQATGTVTPVPVTAPNSFSNLEKPWTPAVEARYTGIRNVALYGSWDYRGTRQDERTTYNGISPSGSTIVLSPGGATEHLKEKHWNANVGASWTPVLAFTARAEVYRKDHENRFDGYGASLGSFYVLDYDTDGVKLSAVVRPASVLSFTTRYVIQRGKGSIMEDGYAQGDSNDTRRYQFGETVDFNPTKNFYAQANVNLVYDKMATSYPRVTGAAQDVLHNSDNNYWNGSVITGFVVNKETDAQLEATYYRANNYNPSVATSTVPYGYSGTDYSVSAGIKYKFAAKTVGAAKVGYVESKNETSGGNSNFRGPVAYVSLEHAF